MVLPLKYAMLYGACDVMLVVFEMGDQELCLYVLSCAEHRWGAVIPL